MKRVIVVAMVVGLAATVAARQARDLATLATESGAGLVAGTVLAVAGHDQPVPARRATVTVSGQGLALGRSVVTDDSGHFVFSSLPAGRFTLTASKSGYLAGAFGAMRPGRPGIPIVLAEGGRLTDIAVTITHGAAIAGTVRDELGVPALGIVVSAFRVLPGNSLSTAVTAVVDDRGAYRIFGLAAGDYIVSASKTLGGLGEIGAMSAAEIDRKLAALAARRPGRGAAPPRPQAETPPPSRATSFAPVFFPRAFSAADASTIALDVSDERLGVDIVLARVRTAGVSGTVAGLPPSVTLLLTLTQSGPVQPTAMHGPSLLPRPAGDGPFQFSNVTPGHYTLNARGGATNAPLWARAEVDVTGEDVQGIGLSFQPAFHLNGRLMFEGSTPPPDDLSAVRVGLIDESSVKSTAAMGAASGGPSSAGSTTDRRGVFDVGGLTPGTYRLTTSLLPSATGWWLRSAVVNGRDVLDMPLVIDPAGPPPSALLTFSDRRTRLSGAIETPPGGTASDYAIVVFPEERSLWLPRARRIRSVRAATDGSYEIRDLPPGVYRLAALTDLAPDDLIDPVFFDGLLPGSIRIALSEGEDKIAAPAHSAGLKPRGYDCAAAITIRACAHDDEARGGGVKHQVVSHDEWLAARRALLEKEKEFTRLGDEMSQLVRDLPWEAVTKPYEFDGANGLERLSDLFAGRSQLVVYHFMFTRTTRPVARIARFGPMVSAASVRT